MRDRQQQARATRFSLHRAYPTYLQPCVFRRSHQDSEAPNSLRLLRSRRHRPRRRTADKRDELAPLH